MQTSTNPGPFVPQARLNGSPKKIVTQNRRTKKPTNWSKVLDEDGDGIYFEGDVVAIRASNSEPFWLAYLDEDCMKNQSALQITWFEIDDIRIWTYKQGGPDSIEQGTILCKVRLIERGDGWQLPPAEVKVIRDIIKDEDGSRTGESDNSSLSQSMVEGDDELPNSEDSFVEVEPTPLHVSDPSELTDSEEEFIPKKRKREDREEPPIILKTKKRNLTPKLQEPSSVEIQLRGTNFQCYKCSFPF